MVNTNEKILPSDFIALKEIVDQEVLRRKYTGAFSPEAYQPVPEKSKYILIEHIENPYNETKRINESLISSLEIAKGKPIKGLDLNIIASAIAELKKFPLNSGKVSYTETGCQSSCTGLCYTSCATGCKTNCSGDCAGGCYGCSGCGGGCSNNCSGGCVNHCAWTCDSGCGGYCYSGDCSGTCYNMTGG